MLGIIMAGGQGTRLKPLTLHRPKPMVEVLGRPVIDYVKDAMVSAGIERLVVTTGYRGEQLQQHVESWGHNAPSLHARVNQEETPMGTAGSVGLLREDITGTCVVGSGDAVASFDIGALLEAHRNNNAKVTMALWEVEDPSNSVLSVWQALQMGKLMGHFVKALSVAFSRNHRQKKPLATSSMQASTSWSPMFLVTFPWARSSISASNCFPTCLRWAGPCMRKRLTAFGLMSAIHLNC